MSTICLPDIIPKAKDTKASNISFLPLWSSHCSGACRLIEEPNQTHVKARQVLGCNNYGRVRDGRYRVELGPLDFRMSWVMGARKTSYKGAELRLNMEEFIYLHHNVPSQQQKQNYNSK